MTTLLDFEKPIAELEGKIEELRHLGGRRHRTSPRRSPAAGRRGKLLAQTYAKLTAWQKTQVARHPDRPQSCDYVEALIDDFMPLAGDRAFGDDEAILGGLAGSAAARSWSSATRRAPTPKAGCKHNFGMARPEGYRKAVRLMELADRFRLPVVTFVDTPGAYPGIDAEARGQAEAIARSIEACLRLDGAVRRRHHRRRRLGRRHRAGGRRPRADAGACGLFGDLARGLRLDPVAQRGAGGRPRPRR